MTTSASQSPGGRIHLRAGRADGARQPLIIAKGRVEAFSDGVIAVAITLLVLDLRVPQPDSGTLAQGLIAQWPNYVAYAVSFVAIGIMWINHHTMLRRLIGVDHQTLVLNVVLLMCIVALPFTTSLLASYLDAPGGHLAAVVYAGSFLVTSSVFTTLQCYLLLRRPHLLRDRHTRADTRAILKRAAIAPPAYLIAGLLGLVSPYLTLAACVVLGVFYLLAPRAAMGSAADVTEDAGAPSSKG